MIGNWAAPSPSPIPIKEKVFVGGGRDDTNYKGDSYLPSGVNVPPEYQITKT